MTTQIFFLLGQIAADLRAKNGQALGHLLQLVMLVFGFGPAPLPTPTPAPGGPISPGPAKAEKTHADTLRAEAQAEEDAEKPIPPLTKLEKPAVHAPALKVAILGGEAQDVSPDALADKIDEFVRDNKPKLLAGPTGATANGDFLKKLWALILQLLPLFIGL